MFMAPQASVLSAAWYVCLSLLGELLKSHVGELSRAREKILTTYATHAFYVQVLMDLKSITKRRAIEEAAKHFSVSEEAIEQSLKRSARDKR